MTNQVGLGIQEIIGNKRAEILRLAQKHGAKNIRIFGSVARGEAQPASDIDFLVEWDYAHMSEWGGVGLNQELEALLGYPVQVVSVNALHWFIRDQVLTEAVDL
jgi:uncharacterized protein